MKILSDFEQKSSISTQKMWRKAEKSLKIVMKRRGYSINHRHWTFDPLVVKTTWVKINNPMDQTNEMQMNNLIDYLKSFGINVLDESACYVNRTKRNGRTNISKIIMLIDIPNDISSIKQLHTMWTLQDEF